MGVPRAIAVVGTKGGCGTSSVTVNLAAAWPRPAQAVTVDLDCGRGDLAGMLDLTPHATLPTLLHADVDVALLRGSAMRHRAGFSVIAQPGDLIQLVRPAAAEIQRLLALTRQAWELTLLDCGSRIDEAVVATLQAADEVLVVCTPDLIAVRNLVRLTALLDHIGVPRTQRRLVINKMPRRPEVSAEDIEAMLGVTITHTFAQDVDSFAKATAAGTVLREAVPAARLTRQMDQFWPQDLGAPVQVHKWWIPWLGGVA